MPEVGAVRRTMVPIEIHTGTRQPRIITVRRDEERRNAGGADGRPARLPLSGERVPLQLKNPGSVETLHGQRWMWNARTVSGAVEADFKRAGLTTDHLLVPTEAMKHEVLEAMRSRRTSAATRRALSVRRNHSVATLRTMARRPQNAPIKDVLESLATHLQAMAQPMNLLEAKHFFDITNRIDNVENLTTQTVAVYELVDPDDASPITEMLFSMTHDGQYIGPGYEPSGFRIYFCEDVPDAAGNCTLAKTEDWPPAAEDVRDGRIYLHAAEQNSPLDPNTTYNVYATAYNVHGESGPSNVVAHQFRSAQRGDLNKNGRFDSGDINLMLSQLLDGAYPRVLADVNADGAVTQADLDALIQLVETQP